MEGFVDSCPQNLTEAIKASTRLGCGRDKYGNDQYMCLPNIEKTGLVELCHNGIMGIIQRGYCLETTERKLFQSNCSGFLKGCPDDPYRSNENYNYPSCQQINTEDHCYLADPSCSARTENIFNTSGFYTTGINVDYDIYNITTMHNQTATIQEYETTDIGAIVVGSYAGVIVLIVLLFIGLLIRRKQRCINKTKEPNPETIYFVEKRESSSESVSYERNAGSVNEYTSSTPLLPTYTEDADKDKDDSHSSVESNSYDFVDFDAVGDYDVWKTNISVDFDAEGDYDVWKTNISVDVDAVDDYDVWKTNISVDVDAVGDYDVWKTNISDKVSTDKDDSHSSVESSISDGDLGFCEPVGDYDVWKTNILGFCESVGVYNVWKTNVSGRMWSVTNTSNSGPMSSFM